MKPRASTRDIPHTAVASITLLSVSPPSPQGAGTPITLTATVQTINSIVPTGTVTFDLGGASLSNCTSVALSVGTATCQTTSLLVGSNLFVGNYSGDANYLPSGSNQVSFVGTTAPGAPANVSITSQGGSITVKWPAEGASNGYPILGYTVTATWGTPSPSDTQTCTVAQPSNQTSSVQCTVPGLPPGASVNIKVTSTSLGGTSAAWASTTPTTIVLGTPSINLTASLSGPQNYGTPVTFIAGLSQGTTGTVQFESYSTVFNSSTDTYAPTGSLTLIPNCNLRTVVSGYASCTTTFPLEGTTTLAIEATYSGDANFLSLTSAPLLYSITQGLGSASSPLTVTSIYGSANGYSLTTSGGLTDEPVTFTAVNGTATGCSVSGSNLSVTSAGTCLVTANQISDGTNVGQTSNVATVSLFYEYPATEGVVGYDSVPIYGEVQTGTTTTYDEEAVCVEYSGWFCEAYVDEEVPVTTPVYTEEVIGYNYYSIDGLVCQYGGQLSGSNCFITSGTQSSVALVPPTDVTAVAQVGSAGSAIVSWTAPGYNGGSAVTNFTVTTTDVTQDSQSSSTCSTPLDSCTVTGLTNGDFYVFQVTATYGSATSPSSEPSNSVRPSNVPGSPTNVVATAYNSSALVTWQPPSSNGGLPVTSYTVTASPGGLTCSTSAALACAITGLSNGVPYTFTVTATNGNGPSTPSAASSPVTPIEIPGAPVSVTASVGNGAAVVSWLAPAPNGSSAITGYTVTASPGGQTCATTGATTCTVIGLTNGNSYTFTVTATNAVGTGPASQASNPVVAASSPIAPTGASAVVASLTSANVTWTAPSSNGGSPITGYTVTASPGGRTCTTTGALTCTVTGLTTGTSYTFTVTATNALGISSPSPASNGVAPATVPGAPTGVNAMGGNLQATVTWVAPSSNGGSAITGYTVTSSPGGFTCTTTGATTCIETGLVNGTSYTFKVTATNAVGTGSASSASSAVVPAITVPGEPTGVTATGGVSGQSTISWTPPSSNGGSSITAYKVLYSSNGGSTWTTATTSTASSPFTLYSATQVSVGEYSACAIVNDAAKCWGYNADGQLGNGSTTNATSPVAVTGLTSGVTAISVGEYSACAIVNGAAKCWGYNNDGQLGKGSTTNATSPVAVTGLTSGVTAISVGEYSACAIVNGFTDCWGYNADGQLGNGSTTNSSTSVLAIPGLENGVSYIFEVAAINAVGTGAYSNPSAAMTP